MLARLGARVSAWFRATAPDPFVIAILLTVVAAAASAWAHHARAPEPLPLSAALWDTLGFWRASVWSLLGFGMEMCLILVTGHALASSPLIARPLDTLARAARTPRQAAALTAACAMLAALLNWGFGLIVGALLARNTIASLRRRGIDAPAGLIAGAGYLGLMVWHGGLSGSAPLKAATESGQIEVLGPGLGAAIGAVPISHTLLSPLNLIVTGGLFLLALALIAAMAPPASALSNSPRQEADGPSAAEERASTPPLAFADGGRFPRFLERSPFVVWAIAVPALALIISALLDKGFAALNLGFVNLTMLALGLLAHGSARSYIAAVEDAARGCAGIIIQFPLYAGIMGMVQSSGLAATLSAFLVDAAGSNGPLLSVFAVLAACIVNLFVPSGGGQWAVQGPIFLQAAHDSGIDPARMIIAIAYGDQLTNMLQPFWALPLLAITRVPAREIVGYTAIVMVAAIAWTCACVYLF